MRPIHCGCCHIATTVFHPAWLVHWAWQCNNGLQHGLVAIVPLAPASATHGSLFRGLLPYDCAGDSPHAMFVLQAAAAGAVVVLLMTTLHVLMYVLLGLYNTCNVHPPSSCEISSGLKTSDYARHSLSWVTYWLQHQYSHSITVNQYNHDQLPHHTVQSHAQSNPHQCIRSALPRRQRNTAQQLPRPLALPQPSQSQPLVQVQDAACCLLALPGLHTSISLTPPTPSRRAVHCPLLCWARDWPAGHPHCKTMSILPHPSPFLQPARRCLHTPFIIARNFTDCSITKLAVTMVFTSLPSLKHQACLITSLAPTMCAITA